MAFSLGAQSRARLVGVHPDLARVVERAGSRRSTSARRSRTNKTAANVEIAKAKSEAT